MLDLAIDDLIEPSSILNSFIEVGRYPGDMDVAFFTRELTEKSLISAETIKLFVIKHLDH